MRFREFVAGRHPFMEVNEAELGLGSGRDCTACKEAGF